MGEEKRYRLLKDTPSDSAGAIFYKNGERYYEINGNIGKGNSYKSKYVEKNPEWFELIEDKIEVNINICAPYEAKYFDVRVSANKELPQLNYHYDALKSYLKEAVEMALNNKQPEKTYSEKELLEAEERAFYAGYQVINLDEPRPSGLWWVHKYQSFSDYKNSTK